MQVFELELVKDGTVYRASRRVCVVMIHGGIAPRYAPSFVVSISPIIIIVSITIYLCYVASCSSLLLSRMVRARRTHIYIQMYILTDSSSNVAMGGESIKDRARAVGVVRTAGDCPEATGAHCDVCLGVTGAGSAEWYSTAAVSHT